MTRLLALLLLISPALQRCRPAQPAPEPEVRRATEFINHVPFYFEIAGQGSTLVLIPGGSLDTRMWDPVFLPLARFYQVIRYDPRGFGRSGAVQELFTAEEDLDGLLGHLGVKRVSLIGLSYGGRVAIDYVLQHPDKVQSLVLVSAGLDGFDWSKADFSWNTPIEEALQKRDFEAVAEGWLASPYMVPAMQDAHLAPTLRQIARDNAAHWAEPSLERALHPPALDRLSEIKASTLVLAGGRDVPEILEIAGILTSRIGGAKRLDFESAGHLIPMEQPERFLEVVMEFLQGQALGDSSSTQSGPLEPVRVADRGLLNPPKETSNTGAGGAENPVRTRPFSPLRAHHRPRDR